MNCLQGKYLGDRATLREAADEAGVENANEVIDNEEVAKEEVRASTETSVSTASCDVVNHTFCLESCASAWHRLCKFLSKS